MEMKRRISSGCQICCLLLSCGPRPTSSSQWLVAVWGSDSNNGSFSFPFASLRRAETAASDKDAVFVYAGSFVLNTTVLAAKNGISWTALGGIAQITCTSGQTTAFFASGTSVSLSGFNFSQCRPAVLLESNASAVISSCTFVHNTGSAALSDGGAIYSSSTGSVQILSSIFWNNSARYGGAIFADAGPDKCDELVVCLERRDCWWWCNCTVECGVRAYLFIDTHAKCGLWLRRWWRHLSADFLRYFGEFDPDRKYRLPGGRNFIVGIDAVGNILHI